MIPKVYVVVELDSGYFGVLDVYERRKDAEAWVAEERSHADMERRSRDLRVVEADYWPAKETM